MDVCRRILWQVHAARRSSTLSAKAPRRAFPIFEAIAALIVLIGYGGIAYLEVRLHSGQPTFDSQSTYDAHPGGYRALYDFLRAEGTRVERFERRPAYLDDGVDTYVIADSPFGLQDESAADFDALERWVKAGGRLVIIGAVPLPGELKVPPIAAQHVKNDRARPSVSAPLTSGVAHLSGDSDLRIPLRQAQTQAPLAADRAGLVASTYDYGKGDVVVIADDTLFQNRNLAHADNARFAYDALTAGGDRSKVVAFDEFSHGFQSGDSLWAVLPTPMRYGAALLGFAFILLLIGSLFRFGPVTRLPVETERTSSEYLASMAALLARGGAARIALRSVADACLRDVAGSLGMGEGTPIARVADALRHRPDGSAMADNVLELNRLRSYERPTDTELLEAVRVAATLRKEYAPYARIGFGRRSTTARRSA
jgi:uncharacterized protein DUF4350